MTPLIGQICASRKQLDARFGGRSLTRQGSGVTSTSMDKARTPDSHRVDPHFTNDQLLLGEEAGRVGACEGP